MRPTVFCNEQFCDRWHVHAQNDSRYRYSHVSHTTSSFVNLLHIVKTPRQKRPNSIKCHIIALLISKDKNAVVGTVRVANLAFESREGLLHTQGYQILCVGIYRSRYAHASSSDP